MRPCRGYTRGIKTSTRVGAGQRRTARLRPPAALKQTFHPGPTHRDAVKLRSMPRQRRCTDNAAARATMRRRACGRWKHAAGSMVYCVVTIRGRMSGRSGAARPRRFGFRRIPEPGILNARSHLRGGGAGNTSSAGGQLFSTTVLNRWEAGAQERRDWARNSELEFPSFLTVEAYAM